MSPLPLAVPLPPLPFRLVTKGTPCEGRVSCHWGEGRVAQKRHRRHLALPLIRSSLKPRANTLLQGPGRRAPSHLPPGLFDWSAATVLAAPYAKNIYGSHDRFPSRNRGEVWSTRNDFSNYPHKAVGIFPSACLQASLSRKKKMIFLNALANQIAHSSWSLLRHFLPESALGSPVPWQREKPL